MATIEDLNSQRFYHGTKADLKLGALILPGCHSNYGQRKKATYVSSKYSVVVAQAAKLIGDAERYELMLDLVNAFDRCLIKPVETDPGCGAKLRIADALYRLEYSNEDLFLRGIRHVQQEPFWSGTEDTAAALRGTCALGLVRMNYPQVMTELFALVVLKEVGQSNWRDIVLYPLLQRILTYLELAI